MNGNGPRTDASQPAPGDEHEITGSRAAEPSLAAACDTADSPQRPRHIVLLSILFEGGLGVVAVAVGWIVGFQPLTMLHLDIGPALWGVAGTVPLLVGLILVDRSRIGRLVELRRLVDRLIVPLFRGLSVWQLAAISLSAGLGEELLFRGLFQSWFTAALGRFVGVVPAAAGALVIASLLFGIVHWISKTYAALCFAIGLYFGSIWLATGNLLAPVVIHALYDWLALIYLLGGLPAQE